MFFFFAVLLTFLTVIFASPVQQDSSDTNGPIALQDSLIAETNAPDNFVVDCATSAFEDEISSEDIQRRKLNRRASICPISEQSPIPKLKVRKHYISGDSGQTHHLPPHIQRPVRTNERNPCATSERTIHGTCSGPEVIQGIFVFTFNCVLGSALVIEATAKFKETSLLAEVCCTHIDPEPPFFYGTNCESLPGEDHFERWSDEFFQYWDKLDITY